MLSLSSCLADASSSSIQLFHVIFLLLITNVQNFRGNKHQEIFPVFPTIFHSAKVFSFLHVKIRSPNLFKVCHESNYKSFLQRCQRLKHTGLLWNQCVPENSHVEKLIPRVMMFGNETFRKQSGHESGGPMTGLVPSQEEAGDSLLPLSLLSAI